MDGQTGRTDPVDSFVPAHRSLEFISFACSFFLSFLLFFRSLAVLPTARSFTWRRSARRRLLDSRRRAKRAKKCPDSSTRRPSEQTSTSRITTSKEKANTKQQTISLFSRSLSLSPSYFSAFSFTSADGALLAFSPFFPFLFFSSFFFPLSFQQAIFFLFEMSYLLRSPVSSLLSLFLSSLSPSSHCTAPPR